MEQAGEYFGPVPIFSVNLFRDEILGLDRRRVFADQIYGGKSHLHRFFDGEPYRLSKEDGEYQLIMKFPFIGKQDVELSSISDELIVRIGEVKRHRLLPRQVAGAKSIRARLERKPTSEDLFHYSTKLAVANSVYRSVQAAAYRTIDAVDRL